MKEAPLVHLYNLGRLPQAGETVAITASEVERVEIARWADLLGVTKWQAEIRLSKLSPTRFSLTGALAADLAQACVVTLEPVPAHIERSFTRELHFTGTPRRGGRPAEPEEIAPPGDGEVPDEIESLHYDLAAPLLEEFSLALAPYPRAPGVTFETPPDPPASHAEGAESPFSILNRLKTGL